MTIKFADGTHMEVAETAFNDFMAHDLKWVEFVHGRATVQKPSCNRLLASTPVLVEKTAPCSSPNCKSLAA
jgi:hypothetical protein